MNVSHNRKMYCPYIPIGTKNPEKSDVFRSFPSLQKKITRKKKLLTINRQHILMTPRRQIAND